MVFYRNPRSLEDVDLYEQIGVLAMLQREWSDNMVSNTLQFDPKKYSPADLARAIKTFLPMLKSTTLLPKNEEIYPQMPFEKITKEEYEKRIKSIPKVNWSTLRGHRASVEFCGSRSCHLDQSPPMDSS